MPQNETVLASSESPIAGPERRALSMRLAALRDEQSRAARRLLVRLLLFFFVPFCVFIALTSNASLPVIIGGCLAGTLLLGLWIGVEEHLRTRRLQLRLSQTLESGRAREIRVVASAVVEFEEVEDEGACYAFQIADAQMVFVSGQLFYSSAKFPNSDFSLVDVLSPSGELVDCFIRKQGEKLVPIRIVSADVKQRLRIPPHLHVMAGTLAQLEQLLAT
jgi:hypothetical protein